MDNDIYRHADGNKCAGGPAGLRGNSSRKITLASRDALSIRAMRENYHLRRGQSYAMFRPAANDRPAFAQPLTGRKTIWRQGSLREHLPARLWGQRSRHLASVLTATPGVRTAISGWHGRCWRPVAPVERDVMFEVGTVLLKRTPAKSRNAGLAQCCYPQNRLLLAANSWRFNPPCRSWRQYFSRFGRRGRRYGKFHLVALLETAPKGFSPDCSMKASKAGS